jgi:hypothetical protein
MCLKYITSIDTELRNKLSKAKNGIICYKVVRLDGSAPVYQLFIYRPGINISNRRYKPINQCEADYGINTGLHVFVNKSAAKRWMNNAQEIILPVRCYLTDFVAAGKFESSLSAIFTQVTISPRTYRRYLKNAVTKTTTKKVNTST